MISSCFIFKEYFDLIPFNDQDSSPPVHFHLTLLRLLLIGEGDLNLHAARGILDEPVE